MTPPVRWRKSSRSQNTSNCVELAWLPDCGRARDSKNPDGPALTVDLDDFIETVKSGRLDH